VAVPIALRTSGQSWYQGIPESHGDCERDTQTGALQRILNLNLEQLVQARFEKRYNWTCAGHTGMSAPPRRGGRMRTASGTECGPEDLPVTMPLPRWWAGATAAEWHDANIRPVARRAHPSPGPGPGLVRAHAPLRSADPGPGLALAWSHRAHHLT
jgi:hypothetical protein